MSGINNILAVYLQGLFGFEVCLLKITGRFLWAVGQSSLSPVVWPLSDCLFSLFFSLGGSECVNSEVLYLKLFH